MNYISPFVFLFGLLLSVIVLFYMRRNVAYPDDRIRIILGSLLNSEKEAIKNIQRTPKVAVGFGSCHDVFINALESLKFLNISLPKKAIHHGSLKGITDFAETFSYFFDYGAAAERYIYDKELVTKIVDSVKSGKLSGKFALGGNAPVMALRFFKEGCNVLLGSALQPHLLKSSFFGTNISVSGERVDKSDIHVIFEYDRGDTWGPYESPRANRFIVHSDVSNPTLSSLGAFSADVETFDPDLVVVSALQMMDNFPFNDGEVETKIDALRNFLVTLKSSSKIHFELASFTDLELMRTVTKGVLTQVDSLGMNEQEIGNLVSLLRHGKIIFATESIVRVSSILEDTRFILQGVRDVQEKARSSRRLNRVHVHSLAFQLIVTEHNSTWRDGASATAKAALTATRHVCGSETISTEKSRLILDESFRMSLDDEAERKFLVDDDVVTCWDEMDSQWCIAPNLVCTDVVQTAGGGDNISAAGLSFQI